MDLDDLDRRLEASVARVNALRRAGRGPGPSPGAGGGGRPAAASRLLRAGGAAAGGGEGEAEGEGEGEGGEGAGVCCRICFGGAAEGPLVAPCRCSGTIKYVHRRCLNEWRQHSANPRSYSHCETCRAAYRVVQHPATRRLQSPAFLAAAALAVLAAVVAAVGLAMEGVEALGGSFGGGGGGSFVVSHASVFRLLLYEPSWRSNRIRRIVAAMDEYSGEVQREALPGKLRAALFVYRRLVAHARALDVFVGGGALAGLLESLKILYHRYQNFPQYVVTQMVPSLLFTLAANGQLGLRLLALGGFCVLALETYEWTFHQVKKVVMRHEIVLDAQDEAAPAAAAAPVPGDRAVYWARHALWRLRLFMGNLNRRGAHPHRD